MNRLCKVICVFAASITILVSLSLSALALSIGVNLNPDNYSVTHFKWKSTSTDDWSVSTAYSFTTADDGSGYFSFSTASSPSYWSIGFTPLDSAGSMTIEDGMYLNCTFNYLHNSVSTFQDFVPEGALYITSPSGVVYQFSVTDTVELYNGTTFLGWTVTFGGQITVDGSFETGDCDIELVMCGLSGTTALRLNFYQLTFITSEGELSTNTAKIVESVDKAAQDIIANQEANTEEIKDKIDESTDEITGAIDESTDAITGAIGDQTDELTNGWGTDDDSADKTGDMVDDLGSAESDALGGKTDEEIKAEVDGALNGFEMPDETFDNVVVVGNMFNDLLNAFGMEYQTVLLLALTLGLAAFLVGRSYRSKGD